MTGSPVSLTGNGGAAVNLTVTPSPLLQFGDVLVGQSSAPQAVTLTNTGAVPVTNISLAGLTGPFTRSAGGCTAAQLLSLPVGGSCAINVVFTPTASNPVNGPLTVSADSGLAISGSPVTLAGNGVSAGLTPSPVAFGDVPHGTQVRMTVTLANAPNVNSNMSVSTLAVANTVGTGFTATGWNLWYRSVYAGIGRDVHNHRAVRRANHVEYDRSRPGRDRCACRDVDGQDQQ